jgi:hypothetical protein
MGPFLSLFSEAKKQGILPCTKIEAKFSKKGCPAL